ncbi:hypothetical protein ACA910_003338 [Epithemia clementina (nom. ined.)]
MGYDQGFPTTGLKFSNRLGQVYHDNDWIAGVDYDEYHQNQKDINYNNDEDEYDSDDDNDDENDNNDYEEQQQELTDIVHEPKETNPTIDNEEDNDSESEDDDEQEQAPDEPEPEPEHAATRRSTRERKPVDRLNLHT